MAATQRLSSVLAHLNPSSSEAGGRPKLLQKNPDDIVRPFPSFYLTSPQKTNNSQVITYAARTPLTKAKKGALKDTPIDDLLIALLTVCPLLSHPLPQLIKLDCPRKIQPRSLPRGRCLSGQRSRPRPRVRGTLRSSRSRLPSHHRR